MFSAATWVHMLLNVCNYIFTVEFLLTCLGYIISSSRNVVTVIVMNQDLTYWNWFLLVVFVCVLGQCFVFMCNALLKLFLLRQFHE